MQDGLVLTRQHIKKQRHYLTDKGPSSQSYGFSSSMNVTIGLERNLSTEELMVLYCGVEEDSRRSNQSILKEISSECSLEGLMLKLKLQ